MVSKWLDRGRGPGCGDSGTIVALAAPAPGTGLNKNPNRIISFRRLFGSPKSAATATNSISRTALNLPHPGAGSNRHGESIMIEWAQA
jgi:hypothetical protein